MKYNNIRICILLLIVTIFVLASPLLFNIKEGYKSMHHHEYEDEDEEAPDPTVYETTNTGSGSGASFYMVSSKCNHCGIYENPANILLATYGSGYESGDILTLTDSGNKDINEQDIKLIINDVHAPAGSLIYGNSPFLGTPFYDLYKYTHNFGNITFNYTSYDGVAHALTVNHPRIYIERDGEHNLTPIKIEGDNRIKAFITFETDGKTSKNTIRAGTELTPVKDDFDGEYHYYTTDDIKFSSRFAVLEITAEKLCDDGFVMIDGKCEKATEIQPKQHPILTFDIGVDNFNNETISSVKINEDAIQNKYYEHEGLNANGTGERIFSKIKSECSV